MTMNVYDRNQAREQLARTTISFLIQRAESLDTYTLPTQKEINEIMLKAKGIVDNIFLAYPPIDTSPTVQKDLPI